MKNIMKTNIYVYQISAKLYRVRNESNNTVKDVWISDGNAMFPENPYNILTPTEQKAIEMELF